MIVTIKEKTTMLPSLGVMVEGIIDILTLTKKSK